MSCGYATTEEQPDAFETCPGAADTRITQVDPPSPDRDRYAGWLEEAAKRLRAIARLHRGWDCDGGLPPDGARVNGGFSLLKCLASVPDIPKPHINPTRDGGVQFEWEKGSRYFEIDIVASGAAAYFYQDHAAGTEKEGQVFVYESLNNVVRFIKQVTGTA